MTAGKRWRRAALGISAAAMVVAVGCDAVPIAGTGRAGFNGESGPAYEVALRSPQAVEQAPNGLLFLADTENNRIRVTNGFFAGPDSNLSTVIGPDLGALGRLKRPQGLAYVDSTDGPDLLFISDTGNNRVLMATIEDGVSADIAAPGAPVSVGDVQVVAGGAGRRGGYSGDGGDALAAQLNGPTGLAVDMASQSLFIADTNNNVVRRVTAGEGGAVIDTVAGTGRSGFSGDGPATSVALNHPRGVALPDAPWLTGPVLTAAEAVVPPLYISDSGNNRIRLLEEGTLQTIAGTGSNRFNGDNAPLETNLSNPGGLAVTSDGVVLVAETGANRVRAIASEGTTLSMGLAYDTEFFSRGKGRPVGLSRPADVANGVPIFGEPGFNGTATVADTGHHVISVVTFEDLVEGGPTSLKLPVR